MRNIKKQTLLPISHAGLLADGPDLVDNICVNERFNLLSVLTCLQAVFSVILKHTDSSRHMQVRALTVAEADSNNPNEHVRLKSYKEMNAIIAQVLMVFQPTVSK